MRSLITPFILCLLLCLSVATDAKDTLAAQTTEQKKEQPPSAKDLHPSAPEKVDVRPSARDDEIRRRLLGILKATGWFKEADIEVNEGVVFLHGTTSADEFKTWAGSLARNTQDVSAVVNKISVIEPSAWNFQPSITGLREQWYDLIRIMPSLAFALMIFAFTLVIVWLTAKLAKRLLRSRMTNPLLRDVVARSFAFCVLLIGLYVVFRLLGLTTIALTILGGTGLLGIILGIAFKDITENLLASIFLSIHRPFRSGDYVEMEGMSGYVQRLTSRSTILLALNGTYIEIPNATVFKSKINNFSINPNVRANFTIPLDEREDITRMQEIALQVLGEHPAVLKDPEPWILVDNLERWRVILCIYFWIDGREYSMVKTKSSVMRLIKHAFDKERTQKAEEAKAPIVQTLPLTETGANGIVPLVTESEAGFRSESEEMKEQARLSRLPEKGEKNLLDNGHNGP